MLGVIITLGYRLSIIKGGAMKKLLNIFLVFMLMITSLTRNPMQVFADEGEAWISVSERKGIVKEVIHKDVRYDQLESTQSNDNGLNAAVFQPSGQWISKGKEANVVFDFIPLTSNSQTRFNIMLFYTDLENFVSIGYDREGWFWEYKVDGKGSWMTSKRIAGPQVNSVNTLEISLKDDKLLAWNTTDDGERILLFDTMLDAHVLTQLSEKSEQIAVKLGTFGSELTKIRMKSNNQDNIEPSIPEFERPVLDVYDPYELIYDFSEIDAEEVKTLFDVPTGKVDVQKEDDAVKLDFKSAGKNLLTLRKTPLLDNYEMEAEISLDQPGKRFGLAARVLDDATYGYGVLGDEDGAYFAEHFGTSNYWSSTHKGDLLKTEEKHIIKMRVEETTLSFFIDGKPVFEETMSAFHKDAGALGFFKDRGMGSVHLYQLKVKRIVPIRPEEPQTDGTIEDVLNTPTMRVRIDQSFPRVLDYTMTSGETMQGQVEHINTLKINGYELVPEVSYQKNSDRKAFYTMKVEDQAHNIHATLESQLVVDDNTLSFRITEIINHNEDQSSNDAIIRTIEIPNHSLVSVQSDQNTATLMGSVISTNTTKSGDVKVPVDAELRNYNHHFMYAFVSNDTLAAGIHSNSQYSKGGGPGDFVRVHAQAKEYKSFNSLGLSSSPWIYHRDVMYDEDTLELPEVSVVITPDLNGDQEVNWQDGAIAFRKIMYSPVGAEQVKDLVAYRIAMNFGSHAQNPFLMTLDGIKKVNLHTDGLGQSILLKGYGSEGHDSGHLNYADIGKRMGGIQEFRYLLDESVDYGARIGIHVNASETYPESKYFTEDRLRKNEDGTYNYGWNWIDQGINIDAAYDLAHGRRGRFEDLKNAIGGDENNLDWVYVDVWGNGQSGDNNAWASHQLAKEINDQGWRLGGEWGYAFEPDSTFQHWAADLTYGGYTLKGINSNVARFIFNHQRDAWIADYPKYSGAADYPLLGGYNMKDFEGWQGRNDYNGYMVNLFENNVPTKFIQHYEVTRWVEGTPVDMINPDGAHFKWTPEMMVELTDPAQNTLVIERKSNDYTNNRDLYRSKTMKLNDRIILDGDAYLLPWNWNAVGDTLESGKLYHFNKTGGQTTWELPNDWKVASVMYYELTETGKKEIAEVPVKNGRVTLEAKADTAYTVYQGKQAPHHVTYGEGAHINDPGFNHQNLDAWNVTGKGAEVVKSQASNDMLRIQDNKDETIVSQTLLDLEPGKNYIAYVGVDNRSDAAARLRVSTTDQIQSNYTHRSIAKNYVKAYAHNTSAGTVDNTSYFQNMAVYFTAPDDKSVVTLELIRDAGDGATYFDDVRITRNEGNPFIEEGVFFQDFEESAQGIYPFVVGNIEGVEDNRTHLSEKNAPYTQRGWNNKEIHDVIEGNWSLKTNGLTQRRRLVYQTIPQNLRFNANTRYRIQFDYEAGSEGTYALVVGDGEFTGNETQIALPATLNADGPQTYEFELEGSPSGQSWFGIYSTSKAPNLQDASDKDANFRSYKDIVLDNIHVVMIQEHETIQVVDENTGIIVEGSSSLLSKDHQLKTQRDDVLKQKLENLNPWMDLDVYHIAIDAFEVSKENTVTIKIPLRNQKRLFRSVQNDTVQSVYRVLSDDTLLEEPFTVNEGEVVVTTHELGTFAINYGVPIEAIDKQPLIEIIEQVASFNSLDYTDKSWNMLVSMVEEGTNLLKNVGVTQAELDTAVSKIQKAIEALILQVTEQPNEIDKDVTKPTPDDNVENLSPEQEAVVENIVNKTDTEKENKADDKSEIQLPASGVSSSYAVYLGLVMIALGLVVIATKKGKRNTQ